MISLSGLTFPPYGVGDIKESLRPLIGGEFLRTLNGELIFSGACAQQKYTVTLSGKASTAPSFEDVVCGQEVQVRGTQSLWQGMRDNPTQLKRMPLEGSMTVVNAKGDLMPFTQEGRTIQVEQFEREEGLSIGYVPLFHMRLRDFAMNKKGKEEEWSLVLEEI